MNNNGKRKIKNKVNLKKMARNLAGSALGVAIAVGTVSGIEYVYDVNSRYKDLNEIRVDFHKRGMSGEGEDKFFEEKLAVSSKHEDIINVLSRINNSGELENMSKQEIEDTFRKVDIVYLDLMKSKISNVLHCENSDIKIYGGEFEDGVGHVPLRVIGTSGEHYTKENGGIDSNINYHISEMLQIKEILDNKEALKEDLSREDLEKKTRKAINNIEELSAIIIKTNAAGCMVSEKLKEDDLVMAVENEEKIIEDKLYDMSKDEKVKRLGIYEKDNLKEAKIAENKDLKDDDTER